MDDLNITLVQSALHWENSEANKTMFAEKISSIQEPTDLILLPEMFTTGFSMNAAVHAETMTSDTISWMQQMAAQKKCVVCGSVMMKDGNAFYNRLIWMNPDGSTDVYDKRHLFRLAEEQKTYTQGNRKLITTLKGWKIAPLICYDLRFPVWSRRTKTDDYDLLLFVANWPDRRVKAWNTLLPARAVENQCYVAGLNRVGADGNGVHHSGYSAVYDFYGEPVWQADRDEPCIKTIRLSAEPLLKYRSQFPFWQDSDNFTIEP